METYHIISIIEKIAIGIEKLINEGHITKDKKVILYGLGPYSFAMRTILSNLGYSNIEGYVSDDEVLVLQRRVDIKNFACRYLTSEESMINVWTFQERLLPFDDNVLILLTAKEYKAEKLKLEVMGYKENIHFFIVYNFRENDIDTYLDRLSKVPLDEVKTAEKEILRYVDGFSRENDIRYWVCGGTLLGTIRHKGFIPWDDDIDIFMPWEDYLKFIKLFKENQQYGIFGFGDGKVQKTVHPYMTVIDKQIAIDEDLSTIRRVSFLRIDVFPLIGMPKDATERQKFFGEYQELKRSIWQEFYATNGKIDVFEKWTARQKDFLKKYDFDSSAYVGVLGTAYGEKDCTHRNVYDLTLRMQFEDIEVNVPAGYKEYLDNLYGKGWMQLPDKDKRKSHHNMIFYHNREDVLDD